MKKKNHKGWLSTLLATVLAVSLFAGIPSGSMESVQAATALNNPRTDSDGVVTYDCVYFGNYWQEDTNGDGEADKQDAKQPIKWRVLSVDGNDAFLIADKNLDMQRYNTFDTSVTWETCTMRSWLNGYDSSRNSYGTDYSGNGASFIGNAFTADEQNAIFNTTLENADNSYYGTDGGNATTDKVFLLSEEDIANPAYGFSNYELKNGNGASVGKIEGYSIYDYAKLRYNTGFAKGSDTASGYTYTSSIGTGYWWLRSPGYDSNYAMCVYDNGGVNQLGRNVHYSNRAVCPALHLNLSSSNRWSYAGTVSTDGSSTGGENPPGGGGEEPSGTETALVLSEESIEVVKGEEAYVSVVISNPNRDTLTEQVKKIRYESADDSIADVHNSGLYTDPAEGVTSVKRGFRIDGVAFGETDITFSSPDGHSVACHVTVIPSDKPVSKADGWYEGTLEAMDKENRILTIDRELYKVDEYFEMEEAAILLNNMEAPYINYQIDNDAVYCIELHPEAEFVEAIYHADFLLENEYSSPEETLYAQTPSEILFRESLNTGVANGAAAWKALTAVMDAAGDGGKLVDYDYTQKDMYMALILSAMECSMKAEIVDKLNASAIKDTNALVKTVNGGLKNAELIGAAGEWNALPSDKKTEIYNEVCKNYEKTAFAKSAKHFSNLKKMLDYADSVEDYVEKCVSYYYMHELSESSKAMLQEMYNQCPAEETELREAFKECLDIMNDSDEEFCSRIATNTFKAVGTELLKSGVSYYWKEVVKNTIYVKNPYLLALKEAYSMGKYVTNVLFNTDSMTEKYFIMAASVTMDSVARSAYKVLKERYQKDKTVENAEAYISAVDVTFNVLIRDCEAAYDYADSGDKAAVSQMLKVFGSKGNEELKNSIHGIQTSYKSSKHSAQTLWVSPLEHTYPAMFSQYEHLLTGNRQKGKEYDIHCPVDVYVYDGEELVASVVDNVPVSKGDITAAAYGNAKSFYFSKDSDYHFVYVGNGTGTMNIDIREYDEGKELRKVSFADVPLAEGTTYTSDDGNEYNIPDYYAIQKEQGDTITPDADTLQQAGADIPDAGSAKEEDTGSTEAEKTEGTEQIPVSAVQISAISKKIAAGKTVQLSVSVAPENATNKTLAWTSSNSKYATVDTNGRVSLKKKGAGKTVTITATAQDGSNIKAAYKIKIMKHAVKSIRLKVKSTSVKAGKSITVKPTIKTTGKNANKALQWTSGNTKYATVSKKGKVKTKKAGKGKTVKITAVSTDGSGKKASIKIKIK
ncbi:MAG: DUF6273 domain-containing protein [Clostridium sp.]|nr:DUF6273 domain-containing protein [Clostridium sp.]